MNYEILTLSFFICLFKQLPAHEIYPITIIQKFPNDQNNFMESLFKSIQYGYQLDFTYDDPDHYIEG